MASLKRYLDLDPETVSAIGRASVIGLHMVSGVAVGCGLGWLLDYVLDTRPWLMLLFFVLGVAASLRNVWLDTQRVLRAQERAEQKDRTEQGKGTDKPGTPPADAGNSS